MTDASAPIKANLSNATVYRYWESNMRKHAIPTIALVAVFAACAGGGSSSSPSADQTVITRAEIEQSGSTDAYTLVENLRRRWLHTRGATRFRRPGEGTCPPDCDFESQQPDVFVYVDGTRIGGREELRNLSTANIDTIEFLNAARANARFGIGHVNGAILVVTRGT
jgi:hypothetical protein